MNTSLDRIQMDGDYEERLKAMEMSNEKVQSEVQGHLEKFSSANAQVQGLTSALSHVIEREKPMMKANVGAFETFPKTSLVTYDAEAEVKIQCSNFIPSLDQLSAKTIGDLMRQRMSRLDYLNDGEINSLTFIFSDGTPEDKN